VDVLRLSCRPLEAPAETDRNCRTTKLLTLNRNTGPAAVRQLHATHGVPLLQHQQDSKPLDLRPWNVDTVNSIPRQFHH
jgi:hypothetical protein